MSELNRPMGELAHRPLHFFWIVDCSGSMIDDRISAVNHAISTALPSMKEEADKNPHAQVLVRTLKFSNSAAWVTPAPVRLEEFIWSNLDAEQRAMTNMGEAFDRLAEQLTIPPMPQRGLPPVLVLLSDGQPTDTYKPALEKLLNLPWAQKSVRIAISIGKDANDNVLREFTGNGERILQANNPEMLAKMIKWISTVVVSQVTAPPSQDKDNNVLQGTDNVYIDIESIPTPQDNVANDVW